MNELPLLTRPQVAELLNISVRTIDNIIASGDLPCVRIGRAVRIRQSSVEYFVEARESRHWRRKRQR